MVGQYQGNFQFNSQSMQISAPLAWGVYYCGHLNPDGSLNPDYIGRAAGENVSIRSRLNDHLNDNWTGVTHFGFYVCTTSQEAEQLEAREIARFNPRYNQRIG